MLNIKQLELSNGVTIPQIGLGVYKIKDSDTGRTVIAEALKLGYRHIDTATVYRNERSVGAAVRESGIARNEIFVTSKVWNTSHGYDKTLSAFDKSMAKLKLEYLDLYLIHWPKRDNAGTWRALERLYADKRVRAIGVSNFYPKDFDALLSACTVAPMIDQVQLHPLMQQSQLREYCKNHNILVEAWSPLMQGAAVKIPFLQQLAQKYGKSAAQIAIRWNVQLGTVTIPKTSNPARMVENASVYDFELTKEDMSAIATLDAQARK